MAHTIYIVLILVCVFLGVLIVIEQLSNYGLLSPGSGIRATGATGTTSRPRIGAFITALTIIAIMKVTGWCGGAGHIYNEFRYGEKAAEVEAREDYQAAVEYSAELQSISTASKNSETMTNARANYVDSKAAINYAKAEVIKSGQNSTSTGTSSSGGNYAPAPQSQTWDRKNDPVVQQLEAAMQAQKKQPEIYYYEH